ncbi:MAG TPA: S8 family serine peptidase [Anaerolineae bacterium]|nr:S8 family serine peptidase [Anaerolineae bacterium]
MHRQNAISIILLLTLGLLGLVTPLIKAQGPDSQPAKGPEIPPHLSTGDSTQIFQIDPTLLYKIDPQLLKALLTNPDGSAQFIVYLKEQTDVVATAAGAVTRFGLQGEPAELTRRRAVIEALQQTAQRTQGGVIQTLQTPSSGGVSGQSLTAGEITPLWIVNAVAAEGPLDTVLALAGRADVAVVRLNKRLKLAKPIQTIPASPQDLAPARPGLQSATPEWGVTKIRADLVRNALGIDGTGVVVANIDTGVDWLHPALQAQYRGYTGPGKPASHAGNWFDTTGLEAGYPVDTDGHGTHTMGTIVGSEGLGVAPGAQWITVRAFDSSGSALNSWLHEAFQWVLAPNGDPALAPDIVNNSWGSDVGASEEFRSDVQALLNAGIFPVFSAGNSGPEDGTVGSPASLDIAFAVGATDSNDDVANFSSRGPSPWGQIKPDVSAPGKNIRSALPGGAYGVLSGTSMAAPHVSGLVALLLQADPVLKADPEAIATLLKSTAVPLGSPLPNNNYGAGRVDAYGAVSAAAAVGRLQGVVSGGGVPLTGASIQITPRNGGASVTVLTGPGGAYDQGLAASTYDVTVSAFGYQSQTQFNVTIAFNTVTTLNFNLNPKPSGTLTGRVTNGSGQPLSATITLDGTPVQTTTQPDGRYNLLLPEGSYAVTATATKHRLGKASNLQILDGATANLDFQLEAAPSILLVDSGRWYQASQVEFYEQALDDARYAYDLWQVTLTETGILTPAVTVLLNYDLVIWSAPGDSPGYVGADDALQQYLEAGGKLLLSGQDIAYFDGGGYIFNAKYLRNYLKSQFVRDNAGTNAVNALPETPLAGLSFSLAGGDGADNQISPDVISINDGDFAGPLLTYEGGDLAGVYIGLCLPYRSIFLPFGFESINNRATRQTVLEQALTWLVAPPAPAGVELSPLLETRVGSFGTTVSHTVRLRNTGTSADLFSLSATTGIPYNWPVSGWPAQLALAACEAQEIRLDVAIPLNRSWHISDTFSLTAQSTKDPAVTTTVTRTTKTPAPILLVDDDRWYSFAAEYQTALASSGLAYDYWPVPKSCQGPVPPSPPLTTLHMFPMVVWYTAYDWYQPLTPPEEDRLAAYLESGGRLLFSSQDFLYKYLENHDGDYTGFAQDYLGVLSHTEDYSSTIVTGEPGNLAGTGLGPYPLTFPPGYRNFTDGLEPLADAQVATRGEEGQVNALTHAGLSSSGEAWHTNFLAYGPELMVPDDRAELLRQSIGWLSWLGRSTVTPSTTATGDGETLTFTATLVNNGWYDLTNAVFTATFPAELTPLSGSPDLDLDNGAFVWNGPLAKNEVKVMTYSAQLAGSLPVGTLVRQVNQIAYPEHGLEFERTNRIRVNFPNLTASTLTVQPAAGVEAGDILTYTLTLRNDGVVDNPIVTATNELPPMLEFVEIDPPSRGNLVKGERSFTWTTALARDENATLTYRTVISYQTSRPIENLIHLSDTYNDPLPLKARTDFKKWPYYLPAIFKE